MTWLSAVRVALDVRDILAAGHIHGSADQLTAKADPLVRDRRSGCSGGLRHSSRVILLKRTIPIIWLLSGFICFLGDEGDLAVVITVADAGETFMHHTVLEHHRMQVAHEDSPVGENGMKFYQQGFIFRQNGRMVTFVLSLAVQVPTYCMG